MTTNNQQKPKLLISILDKKTGRHYDPILYHSVTDAVRTVGVMMSDPRMSISSYPEEFDLVLIAEWYDDGRLISNQKTLLNCSEVNVPQRKEQKNVKNI